jgi:hypothetical protein
MRKRIINQHPAAVSSAGQHWLDLEHLATVEVTSEEPACPIEAALISGTPPGWQAAQPGEQVIRLGFDQPQNINHIRLWFCEETQERTQEFVLRWSADGGQSYREIVRQQYNFSPPGTAREVEDYAVQLRGVTTLELRIVPDIRGGPTRATLGELRLA